MIVSMIDSGSFEYIRTLRAYHEHIMNGAGKTSLMVKYVEGSFDEVSSAGLFGCTLILMCVRTIATFCACLHVCMNTSVVYGYGTVVHVKVFE